MVALEACTWNEFYWAISLFLETMYTFKVLQIQIGILIHGAAFSYLFLHPTHHVYCIGKNSNRIDLPLITWFDTETCSLYICMELRIWLLKWLADVAWWALWLLRPWECLAQLIIKGAMYNSRLPGSLLYPMPSTASALWK